MLLVRLGGRDWRLTAVKHCEWTAWTCWRVSTIWLAGAANVPVGSASSLSCNEGKRLPEPDDTFYAAASRGSASGGPVSRGATRSQSLDARELPRSTAPELWWHKRAWQLTAGPGWTKVKSAGFVKALWGRLPPPHRSSSSHPYTHHPRGPGGASAWKARGQMICQTSLLALGFSLFHLFSGKTWKSCSRSDGAERAEGWQFEAAVTISFKDSVPRPPPPEQDLQAEQQSPTTTSHRRMISQGPEPDGRHLGCSPGRAIWARRSDTLTLTRTKRGVIAFNWTCTVPLCYATVRARLPAASVLQRREHSSSPSSHKHNGGASYRSCRGHARARVRACVRVCVCV